MILPCLFVGPTDDMGRGIFTTENLDTGTVIEISPVLVMSKKEQKLIDQTLLQNYIFEWGYNLRQCCLALGYVSLYNHSYKSNCEYEMDYEEKIISVKTVRFIKKGEELFINYNAVWNDATPLWFAAK